MRLVLAPLLSCLLPAFASVVAASSASPPNVVNLGYAVYQGAVNPATENTQFLGVRFAAAPTGTLRWHAPQAPLKTPGVQQANTEPNRCFQASQGNQATTPFRVGNAVSSRDLDVGSLSKRQTTAVPGFSEDCLFLNVYVPGSNFAQASKKKLPVVVWIHGGGYVAGSASGFQGTDIYDGSDLIGEANGGIVAVVIQYRLGVFGFLPGAKVKAGGVLNAGILDQQFALKWVQDHISKFGGDRNQVTIWGQSAGAGSVAQHLIANGGKTKPALFKGAIMSSLYLPSQYNFNDRIPETLFSETVVQTGCASAKDALACLRGVDVNTLQTVNTNICDSGFFGTFVFVPVVDGTLIQQRPTEALKQRKINGKMLLAVTNTFEGALFVNPNVSSTVQVSDYFAQLFPLLGPNEIAAGVAQYQGTGSNFDQAIGIMGESIFICPSYFVLTAFNGHGFKGEFAIPPGGHGDDVAYYYPSQNVNGIPPFANPDFDKAFPEAFLNFVQALDPNVKSSPTITPQWSVWTPASTNEMLFNRTGDAADIRGITTSTALLKRCEFWASVASLTAQ